MNNHFSSPDQQLPRQQRRQWQQPLKHHQMVPRKTTAELYNEIAEVNYEGSRVATVLNLLRFYGLASTVAAV